MQRVGIGFGDRVRLVMRITDGGRDAPRRLGLLGLLAVVVALSVGSWCSSCGDALATARELEAAGEWEAALGEYQRVLAEDPEDVAAMSGATVVLMVLHRYDEAVPLQEAVVAADPTDVATRVELGFNYLNHQDRAQDAARVLAEAVELQPSAKNLAFLAQAQRGSGEAQAAEDTLRLAIQEDASYAYAYRLLIDLLVEAGRSDEAADVREQAGMAGVALEGMP